MPPTMALITGMICYDYAVKHTLNMLKFACGQDQG